MRKLITEVDGEGLEKFLGQRVLLMCAAYFYDGILAGINDACVLLTEPGIVYSTGPWNGTKYEDRQALHVSEWYVQLSAIESFGAAK